ncbi:MAG: hypothetical protein HC857_07415, partial [Synechococcales cyanobacterium RU_4_20]|nr:hypothetical protein [Synechococcales cyanobacterium RU_4_20]
MDYWRRVGCGGGGRSHRARRQARRDARQGAPSWLAYHKPPGIECTSDRRVAENIIDAVDYPERVFHVGRLDKYSEGLILLTNRGELVNQILRARGRHEKEYVVDVDAGVPT